MEDSGGSGNHLQDRIDRTSASDEPITDIRYLFPESNIENQVKHKTSSHEVKPEATSSKNKKFKKQNVKWKTKKTNNELQNEFFQALIEDKFEDFVKLIKDPRVKLNYDYSKPKYSHNGTCLEIASRLPGRSKYVEALLHSGVEPNVNELLPEPIHYAAREGNPETLDILLQDDRTNINAVDKDGRTALHLAVKNIKNVRDVSYAKCITLLLNHPDFDINKPNKKGHTAVHEAANNSEEIVEFILNQRNRKFDLDTNRVNGRTTREFISHKYPNLKTILPEPKPERQLSCLDKQLLRSLLARNLKKFTKILQQIDNDGNVMVDPNIFYGSPHNSTCLDIACEMDDCLEFVSLLLRAGADPNTVNPKTKETPLHSALARENHKIANILLNDNRINVNAINSDGKSILHIIAEWTETSDIKKQAIDILNLVLKKPKMKINLRDKDNRTAAEIALRNNNMEFLENMLTQAGTLMDLEAVLDPDNITLGEAIRNKFPNLEAKFPLRRQTMTNDVITTLFDHLYNKKITDFVNVLQQREENVDINTDDGNYTLLQYAVLYGLEEPVKELLKADVNPNKTTQYEKRQPIIIASQKKNKEILKVLLETKTKEKLDVNVKDIAGNTALHYASKMRDRDSVVALLHCGAKVLHKNLFGKSHLPLDSIKFFLDESLSTNDLFPDDEKYELIFDYKFMLAYREDNSKATPVEDQKQPLMKDSEANKRHNLELERFPAEIDFLHYLKESYEYREIMVHPLIAAFLHIKWRRVKFVYLVNLLVYFSFVLFVNTSIALTVGKDDGENAIFDVTGLSFLWVFIIYFVVLEIFQFCSSSRVYRKNFLNLIDAVLIIFTGTLGILNYTQSTVVVIVILVSWTELMLMTSRFHKLSSNIEMLKEVIINYFWLLTSYICLLIAFGLSLFSVYHAAAKKEQEQRQRNNTESEEKFQFYATVPLSMIKTLVMMMGEYEANTLLTQMSNNEMGFVLFILFVFLISMVLLNLLTGVAVSDTQVIKANDHILCLESRIDMIYDVERNLLFFYRLTQWFKSRRLKIVQPFECLFKAMLKQVCIFSGSSPENQIFRIRPNEFKNIVLDHLGHKTNSKVKIKILKKTLEIISDRHGKFLDDRISHVRER